MARAITIPLDEAEVELTLAGKRVKLTNLDKLFWPAEKISKGDLLQYYADVAPVLLPIFGDRLLFPPAFIGRGDMSRGGLMLRCVTAGEELEYTPLEGAIRRGRRPPKLAPIARTRG